MPRIGSLDVNFKAKSGGQQLDNQAISAVVNGPGVRRDLRRRGRNVQSLAKQLVGVRTGALKGSIRVQEGGHGRGQGASVTVVAGRPGMRYTGWHHDGTSAHTITARGANTLRFVSNGAVVYRKSVRHPGAKANPFLLSATRAWAP